MKYFGPNHKNAFKNIGRHLLFLPFSVKKDKKKMSETQTRGSILQKNSFF